jgi:hypothetical protein
MGRLVSVHGITVRGGIVIVACVARAFSIHGVVAAGASEAPILCPLGEARPKLPSPLDAMKAVPFVTSLRGEAQTAEVGGDGLKVPEANGFVERESTAHQTLIGGGDDDCR